jgi:hypothetical protein
MSKVTFLELAKELGEEVPEQDEAQEWISDISSEIDYMIPFPCVAQDIQKWILETSYKQQPALSFAAALNVLSVIQGRTIQCQGIKGNIMMLCLAESGEGKDWPMKASRKLLESVGMDNCVYGQMASGAALIDALEESPSMMLSLDEVGHYFAGINSKNSNQYSREIMPIITEIYTSGSDWYSEKKRKGQDARKILEPNLSMMGMSTERQIMDALKSSEVADGSLARFMVVFGRNNSPINENWNSDSTVPDWLKNRLELIKKPFLISSHKIALSDEYTKVKKELEIRFNDKGIELGMSDGDKAMFKPFYYRLAVRSIQMALLIDNCYSPEILKWCADISEKTCEVFIKKFCHLAADNENESFIKLISAVIKESGKNGITKDKFYDKTRRVSPSLKKQIVDDLIDSNKIFTEEIRVNGAKRPSTVYFWKK